jgi:hypothetical protein
MGEIDRVHHIVPSHLKAEALPRTDREGRSGGQAKRDEEPEGDHLDLHHEHEASAEDSGNPAIEESRNRGIEGSPSLDIAV